MTKSKKKKRERLQRLLPTCEAKTDDIDSAPNTNPTAPLPRAVVALPTKKEKKRLSKVVRSERKYGECVFNALLEGVIGLKPGGPTTHPQLLGRIKNFIKNKDLSGVTVSSPHYSRPHLLDAQELAACRLSVEAVHIGGRGYLCSAEDPLLILAAMTFQVDIVHDFLGTRLCFQVAAPRRTVYLMSTVGHMKHEANVEM